MKSICIHLKTLFSMKHTICFIYCSSIIVEFLYGINRLYLVYPWMIYIWYGLIIASVFFGLSSMKKSNRLLLLFLIVTIIPNLLSWKTISNDTVTSFLMIIFLLLICFGGVDHGDQKTIERISFFALIGTAFISMASIVLLVSGYFEVTLRYKGLYVGYNQAGLFTVLSIALSLWFILIKHSKWKAVLIINIILQGAMCILTDSRTSLLMICILLFGFGTVCLYQEKGFVRILLSILATILCVGIFSGSAQGIQYIAKKNENENTIIDNDKTGITHQDEIYKSSEELISVDTSHQEALDGKSELFIRLNALSSDRLILWESAVNEWKKSPIFGYGLENANITYTIFGNYTNTHSWIFNTLLFSGLIGLLLLVLFIVQTGRRLCHNYRSMVLSDKYLVWFVIACLSGGLLERIILYDTKTITFMFWVVLGYLTNTPVALEESPK